MAFTTINYGIVGAGHIGNFHTQQIQNIKNKVKLIGIYDIDFNHAQEVALKNKTCAFKSLKELLAQCDAVSVATPANSHTEITIEALNANCHVFIEKPLATTIDECKKIINVSDNLNLMVQVGHIERFNPAFLAFKNKQSEIPLFLESQRLTPFTNRGIDTNVILDLMIHDIDLVLSLVKSKVETIHANGINILTDSLDLVNARIEFENGSVANLVASRISDSPMRKLRIFSQKNYTSLDLQNHKLTTYRIEDTPNENIQSSAFSLGNKFILLEKEQIPKNNALYEELLAFITSIQTSSEVKVTKLDGLRAIETAIMIQNQIHEQKK